MEVRKCRRGTSTCGGRALLHLYLARVSQGEMEQVCQLGFLSHFLIFRDWILLDWP